MPTNTPRSLQIFDPVLTNLARQYKSSGFIARGLLPTLSTQTLSAQYPVFTKEFFFQNDVDNRSNDRTPAKEVDFEWSMDTYLCEEYQLKVGWTDLEAQQANGALRLQQNKTALLTQKMELAHEVRVANLLRKTTNGGGLNLGATPGTNWDQDTATIELDIKAGVLAIYDATGLLPNKMIVPYKVAYAMCLQEDIRAILRADTTGRGVEYLTLGSRILPSVIHGMEVQIPQGPQVDSGRGGTAGTISEIWGDHVRLLYTDSSTPYGLPAVAYFISHTPKRVTRWRTVDPDINYIREYEAYDLKVVAPDCGYELTALLS